MKKLLSILLSVCLLLTMFIIPVAAEETNEKLYYKFDFSEDTLYTDYANPVLPEGVSYESFSAVSTKGNNVIGYGKIGNKDGLYIRTANCNHNFVFTPLKKDGTPIVLESGKNYVIEWDFTITRFSGAWARPHFEPFTTLEGLSTNAAPRYTAYYETTEGEGDEAVVTKKYLGWAAEGGNNFLGFGSLFAGNQLLYWDKGPDGVASDKNKTVLDAYSKTVTTEGEGEEATTTVSFSAMEENASAGDDVVYDNGISANGVNYSIKKTINLASDEVLEDTYGVIKNEDGSYTFNGVDYNNFLGLSLPGGYGTYYYPGKDEKSVENIQDAEGNWFHRGYSEYYITGLRIYDATYDFTNVNFVNGTEEKTVVYLPGEKMDYPAVPASRNGDVVWSLAPDKYVAVPEIAGNEDFTVYAYNTGVVGFENYLFGNAYVKNVWLTNSMVTDEKAYSGNKSLKYHNYNLNEITTEPKDWSTKWTNYYSYDADTDTFAKLSGDAAPAFETGKYYKNRGSGEVEQGAFFVKDLGNSKTDGKATVYNYTYRLSFKYYIPEGNQLGFVVNAIQFNATNIWWGSPVAVGIPVSIDAAPTDGWQTFEMLLVAKDLEAVSANSGAGNQVIAVKINTPTSTTANARNATIYIDDVTVEDFAVENKVVYHYNDGVTEDVVITEGVETGVAYSIDRIADAPEGKYFAGWYTDEACTVPAGASVMAPLSGTINLYAKYADYKNGGTFNYKDANMNGVNNIAFMNNGVYSNTVTEGGWQIMTPSADGLYIAKANGNSYAFDPRKTDGLNQRTDAIINAGYPYVAGVDAEESTTYADMEVGEEVNLGWAANTGTVIKNADGSAFIPKSNTDYKVTVKMNVTEVGTGATFVSVVAGRTMANVNKGANDIVPSLYGVKASNAAVVNEAGEKVLEFTINTGDLSDAVPVLSLHYVINGFKVKKVAEANEVTFYELDDGRKVYPFEVTSAFKSYLEEVVVTELDSSVTFVNGETQTTVMGIKGDEIKYPALSANINYDHVWSLSADEYVPVPENFDGSVTVYAYKSAVIGFENYASHPYGSGVNISVSDEKAYSGNKSFRYEDVDYTAVTAAAANKVVGEGENATIAWLDPNNQYYWKGCYTYDEENNAWVKVTGDEAPEFEEGKYYRDRNNQKDHGMALWKIEKNKAYKVTYKYFVENITADINVTAVVSGNSNIWTPSAIYAGKAVISKDSAVGEWTDAEIYVNNASAYTELYMLFSNPAVASGDVVYFDDFAIEEVKVVSFVIPEGFVAEVYEGTLKDGVITAYYGIDEEINAPVVVDADGNIVETWIDADGKIVTEFVSSGVYTAYVAPAFIYGDCDDNGKIDTTDLAVLKLNLAGLGELGPAV